MSTGRIVLLAWLVSIGGLPCLFAQDAEPQQTSLKQFTKWAEEFVADPHGDLLVPDDWFEQQFEPATAKKLSAEYRQFSKGLKTLPDLIAAQQAKGNTEVITSVCSKPIDRQATGAQNAALQQMKSPTPLFMIRMVKPGETKGFSLGSFVSLDGKFLMAGKFAALNPQPKDMVAAILCTTPLEMMEKVLQERGLIEGSAEDYLKKVGVLK